jgi:O-antigen ligase
MAKNKSNSGLSFLFGLTFLSPVTYSTVVFEMDAVQRMFFFSISLLLFLVNVAKYKCVEKVSLNKLLLILVVFFPFTFFTAFINGSSSLLILKLSDIIIPLTILLQSALLLVMLGEEKFFKVISYSVVTVSTLFSIVGVLEVFQLKIIPLPSVIPPGSTLGHRSFAAEYLLSSLPFFLILNEYVGKDRKILLILAAIINVSFLLFTRNRSGIIILIVITVIYVAFILIKKRKGTRLKIFFPVLSVLVISFMISLIPVKGTERPDLESTAKTLFDTNFKSNVLRMNFWDASLQMIKENPLAGIGLYKWSGYYPKYFGDYFNDENVTYVHNIHAHNDFLELSAEIGISALLIFLLIYFAIAVYLFSKINRNQKYFPLLLTFLITYAYSLVSFPNQKFASFFLAAVAAGTTLVKFQENEKYSLSVKFKYLKLALIALIIIGGSTSYIKLQSEINFGEAIFFKERRQYAFMLQRLDNVSGFLYPLDASKQPVDYYRGIANYYLRNNREALNNDLRAREIAPFNPIVLNNVAAIYEILGALDSTEVAFERIKLLFPNYFRPQFNLLTLYYETGKYDKAKLLFDELISKYPSNSSLLELKNRYQPKE